MSPLRCIAAAWASLAIAFLAGCDWMPGRPTEADRPVLPSEVKDFAVLYGRNCAGCHGTDGRLGAARPLNDPLYLALVSEKTLQQIIAHGTPGTASPAFAESAGGDLTDEQIDILARDMRQNWGAPKQFKNVALPPYRLKEAIATGQAPGDPKRGRKVYATYCARCHGPDGNGGPDAGSVVDGSYLALVSDQALRTTVIAGRTDLGMPDWRANVPGRPMTGQEISDVVAWLASHRVPFPGQPFPKAKAAARPERR
jgi:cytochrome c oxidase cbb3-type subunit III